MSLVYEKIIIKNVDIPEETWTREIKFEYQGSIYWVTLNSHTESGYSWEWSDKSGRVAEEPEWVSNSETDFYGHLDDISAYW